MTIPTRSRQVMLKRGGTWRSYAYNDGIHGNVSAEAGQLLICKKGGRDASLRCVDPEVLLAECERLGLVEELVHDGDKARVEHQLVATTSGVLFEIEFSEGVRFTPRLVPPGVAFAVPGPDGPSRQLLTTQEGDVELLIDDPSDEGNSVSLLLRKETAAEHKATLQEMADAAKRIAGGEAAEEAAREKRRVERREREEARKAAGVKKRKRRRKPDK